jgi:hypothetical protein
MDYYLWIVVGAVVLSVFVLILITKRKRKLSPQTIERFTHKILKTADLDPAHALLESHKIFVAALSELSKGKLTASQKISRIQKRIPHATRIWTHHRLRNRVAHETDVRVSKLQADTARNDFIRVLKALG